MSGLHETIATLTGKLQFLVDNTGLTQFRSSLAQVERQMIALSKQADQLADKLSIQPKASTQKLEASLERYKSRALQTEAEVAKAKRQTFQAELHQQKLRFAGHKEDAFLTTQTIKQQQLGAVMAAKAARAEQEQLKSQGIALRNQQSVEAAKLRQSRLEEILRQQQQKTVTLQEKHLQQMTATQRLELKLQQARESGMRAVEKHHVALAAAKAREQRTGINNEQRDQRFQWQQTRQNQWQANQDRPVVHEETNSGTGLVGSLGGIAAAVYVLSKAVGMITERVGHREESTKDTQQFQFALMSASEDPKVRTLLNKRYKETFEDYGNEIDTESARQYNNSAAAMMKHGYSAEKSADVLDDRYAAFRIGNVTDANQKRIATHLDHILAAGHATGQNTRPLMSELGGKVAQDVYVGSARALGFNGKDEGAQGFFYRQQKAGKLTADAFYAGIHQAVVNNPEVLARHKGSIEAREARLHNDQFLQLSQQQDNPELVTSINERIGAERELVKAMAPVNAALVQFDIALTKMSTDMLHWVAGLNPDGSKMSDKQRAQEVGTAGFAEAPAIDPSAFGGKQDTPGTKPMTDPIDKLWNWITGAKDDTDGPANKLKIDSTNPFGGIPQLNTSGFDSSHLPRHLVDMMETPWAKAVADVSVASANNNPRSSGFMSSEDYLKAEQQSVTNNSTVNNNTTNVTNAPVTNVTVNAETNAHPDDLARTISEQIEQHREHELRHTAVNIGSEVQ